MTNLSGGRTWHACWAPCLISSGCLPSAQGWQVASCTGSHIKHNHLVSALHPWAFLQSQSLVSSSSEVNAWGGNLQTAGMGVGGWMLHSSCPLVGQAWGTFFMFPQRVPRGTELQVLWIYNIFLSVTFMGFFPPFSIFVPHYLTTIFWHQILINYLHPRHYLRLCFWENPN